MMNICTKYGFDILIISGSYGGHRRLLGHFTGNCHFIGNREATSWEKILGRKLPLHWKQQLKYFTGIATSLEKLETMEPRKDMTH